MRELFRMYLLLEMDRPIDKDKHVISPGGYEINHKCFDFNQYEGCINKDNPCLLECYLRDFDDSLDEEIEEVTITARDINKGFNEFYIYVGEYGDPEINVKEVKEIVFEMYDPKTDKFSKIVASKEILESANKALNE